MRVILAQTPLNDTNNTLPLGLLCLASYLKKHGHQPIILDFDLEYKKQNYRSDFFKCAAKKILAKQPHLIGLRALCNSLPSALLIAKECHALAPKIPIILGGPEVSFDETVILKTFKYINFIIRGEAEITFIELLHALENNLPLANILGLTYREKSQVVRNPNRPLMDNLDTLPFPNYSLLPHLKKYQNGQIEAGRGCPFRCTFCSTCKMWQRNFRIKSPQRMAKELEAISALFEKKPGSAVGMVHDHLLTSRKITDEFLSLIAGKGLTWKCSSRLEPLNEDLIKRLKQAGCHTLFLGIESGSPHVQKMIKKNLPLQKLPQVLALLSQLEAAL
jgi:radical SAM superfamily enzyme YgiQ (UPF0313 family)